MSKGLIGLEPQALVGSRMQRPLPLRAVKLAVSPNFVPMA